MLTVQVVLRTKNTDGSRGWDTLNSKGTLPADVVANGTWYLRWVEDGKRERRAIGAMSVGEAKHRQAEKEIELRSRALSAKRQIARGTNAPAPPADWVDPIVARQEYEAEEKAAKNRAKVEDYIAKFNRTPGKKKPSTMRTYANSLRHFVKACKKTYIDELKRRDILALLEYLRDEGMEERSVDNVYGHVIVFLKWAARTATEHGHNEALRTMAGDAAAALSLQKEDLPAPEDDVVEVYSTEELKALYAVATEDELAFLKFFEFTGMRDAEVRHADWSWIDWSKGTATVQANKKFDWTPKSKSSKREVPMPPVLAKMLMKVYTERPAKCGLIFPAEGCTPNPYFLEKLRRVVKRAGLDPETFWLHKFRATFATQCLRSGVDVFTTKTWLGHSPKDMVTIGRYVAYLQGEQANTQMAMVTFASQ